MQTNRSNTGALIGGAVMIACGFLSLATRIFRNIDWGVLWPFLIITFGGLFFVAMFAGGRQASGFAIPGSIVGGIGLILLFQNVTGRWESMSYFWAMIIVFVGLGIYIMGWYGGDAGQKQSGAGVMKVGLILFIVFGSFFEMIFAPFGNFIFPILLMLLGGWLILSRSGIFGRKNDSSNTSDSVPPAS